MYNVVSHAPTGGASMIGWQPILRFIVFQHDHVFYYKDRYLGLEN